MQEEACDERDREGRADVLIQALAVFGDCKGAWLTRLECHYNVVCDEDHIGDDLDDIVDLEPKNSFLHIGPQPLSLVKVFGSRLP